MQAHIHGGHTVRNREWRGARRRPTLHRYCVLNEPTNVETQYGTLIGRPGDVLLEGVSGAYYVLTWNDFVSAYDVSAQ